MKINFIMHPNLFESLKNVQGFTNLNGNNYFEHICIIFEDKLLKEQKEHIKQTNDVKKALEYLTTIIPYTHDFTP